MYINETDLSLDECISQNLEYSSGAGNQTYVDFVIVSIKELDNVIDTTQNITKQIRSYIKKQFENFDFCKMKNTAIIISYLCDNKTLKNVYFKELILLYYYKHYQKMKKEFSRVTLLINRDSDTKIAQIGNMQVIETTNCVDESDLEPTYYEIYEKQRLEHLENHMKKLYPKYSVRMAEYLAESCILEHDDKIESYLETRNIPLYARYILKEICDIRCYAKGISKNSLRRFYGADVIEEEIFREFNPVCYKKPEMFHNYMFETSSFQMSICHIGFPFVLFIAKNLDKSLNEKIYANAYQELQQQVLDFSMQYYVGKIQYVKPEKQIQSDEWEKSILTRLKDFFPTFLFTNEKYNQLNSNNLTEITVNPYDSFKFLRFGLIKNPFHSFVDGVYEINLTDYIIFLHYMGLDSESILYQPAQLLRGLKNKDTQLFMCKYNQNYGFFIKSKNGISLVYKRNYKRISTSKNVNNIIDEYKKKITEIINTDYKYFKKDATYHLWHSWRTLYVGRSY